MKNLVLILILANVLYFLYNMYTEEGPQPGVAIVDEGDLGPPLDVTFDRSGDSVSSVGAVLGSGEPSALAAVVGRSCVTIGPFTVDTDADSAVLEYSNEGMRTVRRQETGKIFVGHWVQIRNIIDATMADEMLETLKGGGLSDAYIVHTEDEGMKISLGLFGDVGRAEKIELQARSLDLPAEIAPRTREGKVFFVDIGLPPGKGAAAILAKYGEDRVLLRDKATCPN